MSKEKKVVEVPVELHNRVLEVLSDLPIKYANTLIPLFNDLKQLQPKDV